MNEIAIAVGVILFPGIIATIIADHIVVHVRPWGTLKYGLYSFVLGVSCYVALQFFVWLYLLLPESIQLGKLSAPLSIWNVISDTKTPIRLAEVGLATGFSIPIAFLVSWIVNNKILINIAKYLRVSTKYGDENLYSFYLNSSEVDWVYIRDIERNLTYQGKVQSFSENNTIQEIVLTDATIFGYEDSEQYYTVPNLYLCREHGKLTIETIPKERLGEQL